MGRHQEWVGHIQTTTMTLQWFDPAQDIKGMPTSRLAIFDQNASGEIWLYNTYYSSLSHFDKSSGRLFEIRPSVEQQ